MTVGDLIRELSHYDRGWPVAVVAEDEDLEFHAPILRVQTFEETVVLEVEA